MLDVFAAGIHPSRVWMSGSWVRAMECMFAQARPRFMVIWKNEFLGNGVRNNSKGKNPLYRKILSRGGSNPPRYIKQDSEPNTLQLFRPNTQISPMVNPKDIAGECRYACLDSPRFLFLLVLIHWQDSVFNVIFFAVIMVWHAYAFK